MVPDASEEESLSSLAFIQTRGFNSSNGKDTVVSNSKIT